MVIHALLQDSEVIDTRDTLQTGLAVTQIVDLVDAHAVAVEVEDDARVNVTGTGTHHQTSQRGQPHRGIHRLATSDSRTRRTITQVQRNLVDFLCRLIQKVRHLLGNKLMRGAVEAVTTDIKLRCDLCVERVQSSSWRHGVEETSVEDGDVRHVRKQLARLFDAYDIGRVVQRRQRNKVADHADDFVGNQLRSREQATTVNDAVTDGRNIHRLRTNTVLIHQLERAVKTTGVVSDRLSDFNLLSGELQINNAVFFTNALHQTGDIRRLR